MVGNCSSGMPLIARGLNPMLDRTSVPLGSPSLLCFQFPRYAQKNSLFGGVGISVKTLEQAWTSEIRISAAKAQDSPDSLLISLLGGNSSQKERAPETSWPADERLPRASPRRARANPRVR
jgi:hypothetical protein